MVKIYHNSRCRKSREGLAIIENSGKPFKIIKYIDEPISEKELINIIHLLGIKPIDLVRKNESIWKSNYKNLTLSDKEIINILILNPKLIERPIVIYNNKAIIGRPPEIIKHMLNL